MRNKTYTATKLAEDRRSIDSWVHVVDYYGDLNRTHAERLAKEKNDSVGYMQDGLMCVVRFQKTKNIPYDM